MHTMPTLSLEVLHIILLYTVVDFQETKSTEVLQLSHVSRTWRYATHSLPEIWKPFILDATSPRSLSCSIRLLRRIIQALPNMFLTLDAAIKLSSKCFFESSEIFASLITQRALFANTNVRKVSISVDCGGAAFGQFFGENITLRNTIRHLTIINRAPNQLVHVSRVFEPFKALQNLKLYDISILQLPEMPCLQSLLWSVQGQRTSVDSAISFLRRLPHLRSLAIEGTPIDFKAGDSSNDMATLFEADYLSNLTFLKITGLRSSRERTRDYLAHLLALLSPAKGIVSLEVETGSELINLVDALFKPWAPHCFAKLLVNEHLHSPPRFPNLRSATFRLINPPKSSLQRLLKLFSTNPIANLLLLQDRKEYRLSMPVNRETRLKQWKNIPALRQVEFTFIDERQLRNFIDIAVAKKTGLRTIQASWSTIWEMHASKVWSDRPFGAADVRSKEAVGGNASPWLLHVTCEDREDHRLPWPIAAFALNTKVS